MSEYYELTKDYLKPGGFAELGFSGFLNKHIKAVERVSDTQVKWTVESENGKTYTVTVSATIPTESGQPNKKKRTDPTYSISEVNG